jgi:hypothetical protein
MIKIKFYKKKSLFIGCCVIKAAGRQQANHHGRATTLEGMSKHGSKQKHKPRWFRYGLVCSRARCTDLCVHEHVQNAGGQKLGDLVLCVHCYPSFPQMSWWRQQEPSPSWLRFSSPQSAEESQGAHITWISSTHRCQARRSYCPRHWKIEDTFCWCTLVA